MILLALGLLFNSQAEVALFLAPRIREVVGETSFVLDDLRLFILAAGNGLDMVVVVALNLVGQEHRYHFIHGRLLLLRRTLFSIN
mmetsp:Transcript_11929/g.18412  ORF Transcript_11929/g.18412 Transcript_11929/m.18412 type:complete len:85 (+) Transcript_11929:355-609(+)